MLVLIADDDRLSRTILAETVERMGHEVVVAPDGAEALALLESPEASIQMAILDWTMPHLDGPEVCARVRARKTSGYVYLILVSARSKPENLSRDRRFASLNTRLCASSMGNLPMPVSLGLTMTCAIGSIVCVPQD